MIDDDVRADVRAALHLAASTDIEGGALDGVDWTSADDRVVRIHPSWRSVDALPPALRDTLRAGRTDLVAVAGECRRTGAWAPLLAAVGAWCSGTSEHAAGRARRVLGLPDAEARLAAAVATLDAGGPVEAYFLLLNDGHLRGWGPALFTRFLDAADRRDADRALGLDAGLAAAVNALVPGSDLAAADWATAEYAFYLGLLHRIATEAGVPPTVVEAALAAKFSR